jgi:hypothetical protein
MPTASTPLEAFLARHDDAAWRHAAVELVAETHAVDRTAVRIWLAFHKARAMGAVSIVIPPSNGVFGALAPKDASTLVGVP